MATIDVDFPRFLLPNVMPPQRDTLKYSSTFLRSDRINARCFLEEQVVTDIFQKMNVKSLRLLDTFARPCWMMFVKQFSLDQTLDRVCF